MCPRGSGTKRLACQSKTIKKSLQPSWRECFTLPLSEAYAEDDATLDFGAVGSRIGVFSRETGLHTCRTCVGKCVTRVETCAGSIFRFVDSMSQKNALDEYSRDTYLHETCGAGNDRRERERERRREFATGNRTGLILESEIERCSNSFLTLISAVSSPIRTMDRSKKTQTWSCGFLQHAFDRPRATPSHPLSKSRRAHPGGGLRGRGRALGRRLHGHTRIPQRVWRVGET